MDEGLLIDAVDNVRDGDGDGGLLGDDNPITIE